MRLGKASSAVTPFPTLYNRVPFLCNSKISSFSMSYEKYFLEVLERINAHLSISHRGLCCEKQHSPDSRVAGFNWVTPLPLAL